MAKRCAQDCRPFVRARFVEIGAAQVPSGGQLVTTTALQQLPALTHSEALNVPLRCADAPEAIPGPMGLDLELCSAVANARSDAQTATLAKIDSLLAAGAHIDRACALHCAACNSQAELITAVLERGADVNARDAQGDTALMVAAKAVENAYNRIHNPHDDTTCMDLLLAHGADVSLVDSSGYSALGNYRLEHRNYNDFRAALLDDGPRPRNLAIEARLCPRTGPTDEDEAAR
jgi:hypothetical protein